MKKSKFLQNSKDMLSRSFNPTKCKTSLRLAGSRLKLLRNKKEVQVKQMKREIAKLLESGQDQTARIRVEHVVREEKLMAAYDLLEIYCELIVARLPIIESQKDCPIDLKEAIASIVFASPRCGDVPELLEVRKHFSAKYGKEFTTAAIELRPQCGVGRLLVEKLSAMAPDGRTKIKILSAIAEEHGVKWDPMSFEEKDSGGSSSISKESVLHTEPPRFEAADVQALPSNNMHSSSLNFAQQDARISLGAEKLSSAQTTSVSTKIPPEAGLPGDSYNSHLGGQRWNMEFKDASSAAQAAAESAERASIAARAAAELSSHGRILTQYSTESRKSDVYFSKDEGHGEDLNLNSFEISEASVGLKNVQIDGTKPSSLMTFSRFKEVGSSSEEYNQSASLKSKASGDDDSLYHAVPFVDEYTRKNSIKEISNDEMNIPKQYSSFETETANDLQEKAENLGEGKIVKQRSLNSCSRSSISDDVNIFAKFDFQNFENDAYEDSFISKAGVHGEVPQTDSHGSAVFFDKSDSDNDDHVLDEGPTYDEQDLDTHLPPLGQKSPEWPSINIDSWSPRSSPSNLVKPASPQLFFTGEKSSLDFSGNTILRDDSELDNFAPVTFDDSDGSTSESDEDMNSSKVEDSRNLLRKHNERGKSVVSPFKNEEYSEIDSKQFLLSSDEEGMPWKRNQVKIFDADSTEKLSLVKPSAEQPALGPEDSQIDLKDIGNDSNPESGEGLNFGKLTGGFRHKGHTQLPFFKNRSDESSSVKKEAETTTMITTSMSPLPVEHPKIDTVPGHMKSSTTPDLLSESDNDSSEEEEYLQKSSGHGEVLIAVKAVKTKSSFGDSNSIFCSDDGDLDEDYPKESLNRKSHLQTGISRRTKPSPTSVTNSYSETRLRSEAFDSDGINRKPTTSYNSETRKKSESHGRKSGKWENYEQRISGGVASLPGKSNFRASPQQPDSTKATSVMKESNRWLKSEAHDSDDCLGKKPSYLYSPDNHQEFQPSSRNSSQLGNPELPISAEVTSKPTNSMSWGNPEKPNSGKSTYKTMQVSNISWKSSAVEEPPSPHRKSDALLGSENPRTETLNKTSSDEDDSSRKTSHVHPKLPDYDTLVQSLRLNRS